MRFASLSASNLVNLVGGIARQFPGRIFGSAQGHSSADFLAEQMAAIGLEPIGKDFFQTFTWEVAGQALTGKNVGGILEGTDPLLKNEFIIVTAHHDSQHGTHQGANDNGSGCAGVLAIARALAQDPPKRSVLFLTFDGEEGIRKDEHYHPGRRGSKYYAAHPIVPLAKTAMLINLDMIGQVHLESGSRKDVYQWASDDPFAQAILRRASEKALRPDENAIDGYPEQPRESQFFTTDAEPLYRLGVPTINFLSGRDLDNHHPNDDLSRVIPSRIEQYVRLAHQCAVEAANHPESLFDMGIVPGGLLPAFPLIRERKSAGLAIVQEEQLRLDDLALRLPELKQASAKLAASVAKMFEIEEISEPSLAKIRDTRDAQIEALRKLPKSETEARRTLATQIDTLGAIADVLSGAIYLAKIDENKASKAERSAKRGGAKEREARRRAETGKLGGYYLQRIPEKLADLLRGAERLGLEANLEGIVRKSDVEVFTADVTTDRAVHVARQSLANLSRAIGQAVYATWRPEAAAKDEPGIGTSDARVLREALVETASALAGEIGVDDEQVRRLALVRAMLDAQLAGVKGTGDTWLARFARANVLTEFVDQALVLDAPELLEKAERLEATIAGDDLEPLEAAVLDFYGAIGELAFGRPIKSIEELSRLDRDRIDARVADVVASITLRAQNEAIDAARHDPLVKQMAALSGLMEASLSLASLYKKDGGLKAQVGLRLVRERLDAVIAAAGELSGGEKLHSELRFWSDWLEPFVPLEPRAKEQAKLRAQIAQDGLTALDGLCRSTGDPLEGPFLAARQALSILENEPAPKAEKQLSQSVDEITKAVGLPASALEEIRARFERMYELDGATIGRAKGQRSGPLAIVALRAEEAAR